MLDGDDPADDLTALRSAASVEDLHLLLVRSCVSGRSSRHQEAVDLFVHHHRAAPAGSR